MEMIEPSLRAIIFDFGGVLVRTEDRAPRTQLAQRLGMDFADLDNLVYGSESSRRAELGMKTARDHWIWVCGQLNLPASEIPALQEGFWGGDRLDTTLIEAIRQYRKTYKVGLLSNAWDDLREVLQTRYPILSEFDAAVISSEVGNRKPHYRIYHLAARWLGVQPAEAIFIDDLPANVEGAREAGLHAIHFRSREQALDELDDLLQSYQ